MIEELKTDGVTIAQFSAKFVDEHCLATTEVKDLDFALVLFFEVRNYFAVEDGPVDALVARGLRSALHEVGALDMVVVEDSVVFLEVVVEDATLSTFEEVAMHRISQCCGSLDIVVAEYDFIAAYNGTQCIAEFHDRRTLS